MHPANFSIKKITAAAILVSCAALSQAASIDRTLTVGTATSKTPAPIAPVFAIIKNFTSYTGPFPYMTGTFCVSETGAYTSTLNSPSVSNGFYLLRGGFSPSTGTPSTPLSNFMVFSQQLTNTVIPDISLEKGTLYSYLLIFSSGNSAVKLTIEGAGDVDFSYTGTGKCGTPRPPGPPPIELTGMRDVSESGSSANITVTLNGGVPTANVVLPIVSTNTKEVTVSPASLTFTPGGATTQTFTITGVDDFEIDGDQSTLVQVGPAQSSDPNYANYQPTNFYTTTRDNDVALPSLVFSGTSLNGYLDITNTGSTPIGSVTAKVYDKLGTLKGSGTLATNLPGKGNASIDMATLQSTLGVSGVSTGDYARVELFPVGGNIVAQSRIRNGSDTYNASASSRGISAGLQSSISPDAARLRITNLTSQPQDARATAYDSNGRVLGAENTLLSSALPAKGTVEFDSGTLQSLLGVSPWPARAWLKMSNPDSFGVQLFNSSAGVRSLTVAKPLGSGQPLHYIQPPGDANVVSMIRIYNNESYTTAFDGFLYGADGTLLATVPLGSVPAHGVLLLTNSQLKALPGVPAWTEPASLTVASDGTRFQAQGSIRNQGYLTDTTSVITDGIVAHLPDSSEGLDIEVNIINTLNQATTLTGTLTNGAGQTIGAANFPVGTLAAHASRKLTRADLQTLAGNWTGRATLTLVSSAGTVEVLALLRNATTGALTNLSERPLR